MNRWLMLSAGLIVFALAYVAFYEFVRPRLAQLKCDMPDDKDDDFLFYAMITAIIVTTVIVIVGLVISVLNMIGA